MLNTTFASILAVFAVVSPLVASASPVTIPPDLHPGDEYRLVFVTSKVMAATRPDVFNYNSFVDFTSARNVPELAALNTTWRAIVSTTSVEAYVNTGTQPSSPHPNTPIYLTDGTRIANGYADLWDGIIAHPIQYTEQGTLVTGIDRVWTGTSSTGSRAGAGLGVAGFFAIFGRTTESSSLWVESVSIASVSDSYHFYGISDLLTVPVPEPSSILLATFGLAGLVAWGWRRRTQG